MPDGSPQALSSVLVLLAVAGIVGGGFVGGILFAFSNFAMRALASLPPSEGMRAMQRINETILNPLFFGLFFGTALASAGSVVAGAIVFAREDGRVAGAAAITAGLAYGVGVFAVTALRNVPLNDALARTDPAAAEAPAAWAAYREPWLRWNHVRSLASLACLLGHAATLVFLPT